MGKAARNGVRHLGKGNGTAIPGRIALAIDPGALASLVAQIPRGAVLVTGSNGKGTTCRMISQVMLAAGLHPVLNTEGSSQRSGLATTMVAHAAPAGHLRRDFRAIGLFEVDEGSFPEVVRHVRNPAAVVITNLFEDELDRYAEPAYIVALVERALRRLPQDTVLILNADDPRVASLGGNLPNSRLYFGMADTRAGRTAADPMSDLPRCPRCGGELSYSCVFYGHLGHWACAACGLQRPSPQISVTSIELGGAESARMTVVTAAGTSAISVPLPGLYNAYNALAAVAAATSCELPEQSLQAIGQVTAGSGRLEHVEVDGRDVYLAAVKNASGCTELLRAIVAGQAPKRMLLGLNTTPGKHPDTSWIWDADFDSLAGLVLAPVVSGDRAADLAVRLKYAGWLDPGAEIIVQPDPIAAFRAAFAATPPGEPLWIVSTSIALAQIRDWLQRQGYVRELWQEYAQEQERARRQPRVRWPRPAVPPAVPLAVRVETVELPAIDMPPLPAAARLAAASVPGSRQAVALRPAGKRKGRGRLGRRPLPGRPQPRQQQDAEAADRTRLEQSGTGR